MFKDIRIYEVSGTDLLYVITDQNKNAVYYNKNNLKVSGIDGKVVLTEGNTVILSDFPYDFLIPKESSLDDLVEIIQGYLNNLLPQQGESPFKPVYTAYGYSPSIDAFGRARVSQLTSQGDIKQLYEFPTLFLTQATNGTGNVSHSTTGSASTITTSASGDWAIVQTRQRYNYSSGKSQEIFQTFYDIDSEENVEKRFGYFSSSVSTPFNTSYDGFWIEASNETHYIVTSRSGTETSRVAREDWYDPLDGTGVSGLDFGNLDGNIILQPDFEWLGLGQLRYVVIHGGLRHIFHVVDFVNGSKRLTTNGWVDIDVAFKGVYMTSPNQPLRWEVRQTGAGSSSSTFICSTVGSEGALNKIGKDGGISDNGTHLDADSVSSWYYAIGIRLNSTKLGTLTDLLDVVLKSDTNDDFEYRVCFNPTYNGTVTYTPVTNYAVEYGLGATANDITDFGSIMKAGYGTQLSVQNFSLDTSLRLGADIDGTRDEVVVIVRPHSINLDIHRSINWKELN